jgi:uncharacterized protein involved in exopolysaccharide biosynthesis
MIFGRTLKKEIQLRDSLLEVRKQIIEKFGEFVERANTQILALDAEISQLNEQIAVQKKKLTRSNRLKFTGWLTSAGLLVLLLL